jgi:hypothetical protein
MNIHSPGNGPENQPKCAGPGCGMAMPHVLAGESPAWVEASRQPSIETCRR